MDYYKWKNENLMIAPDHVYYHVFGVWLKKKSMTIYYCNTLKFASSFTFCFHFMAFNFHLAKEVASNGFAILSDTDITWNFLFVKLTCYKCQKNSYNHQQINVF